MTTETLKPREARILAICQALVARGVYPTQRAIAAEFGGAPGGEFTRVRDSLEERGLLALDIPEPPVEIPPPRKCLHRPKRTDPHEADPWPFADEAKRIERIMRWARATAGRAKGG